MPDVPFSSNTMAIVDGYYPLHIKWTIPNFFNIPATVAESDQIRLVKDDNTRVKVFTARKQTAAIKFANVPVTGHLLSKIVLETIPEYESHEDQKERLADEDRLHNGKDNSLTLNSIKTFV